MAAGQAYDAPVRTGSAVPTAEQLRRSALARAESRGKWVAMRRLAWRQIWHVLWTLIFPVLGLLTSVALVIALALTGVGIPIKEVLRGWFAEPAAAPAFNSLQLDRQLSEPSKGTLGAVPSNNQ